MFISSLEKKTSYSKPGTVLNTRSQSSLSTISMKSLMPKDPVTSDHISEVLQLKKKKSEIESKLLEMMKEMKRLKTVSKSLKSKEKEFIKLQESLVRSNEELVENRIKFDKSESMLKEILRNIKNHEDFKLLEIQPSVGKHIARIRTKKNSILIDEFNLGIEMSRSSSNTSRDVKIRSPYFCSNFNVLGTPKVRKVKVVSTPTKVFREDKACEHLGMQTIFDRLKNILEYLNGKKI